MHLPKTAPKAPPRLQRFKVHSSKARVIVRHVNSRYSCFWLTLQNISASGIGVEHLGLGFLPFTSGDDLIVTLDTGLHYFPRPIHLSCVVKRRVDESPAEEPLLNQIFLGLEIITIHSPHEAAWTSGLWGFGNPFVIEPLVKHGK